MPPARGDRLADQPVLQVVAPDGSSRTVVALPLAPIRPPVAGTHRVVQGDAIDSVAHRHLGDARAWWQVLDANPLRYPLDLEPGELLALPGVAEATRASRTRSF